VIVNELKLSIIINKNSKIKMHTKKTKKNANRKICLHRGRTQANRVIVQLLTTDILTPCLLKVSWLFIKSQASVTNFMASIEYSYQY
jgi:hypothetical protein